MARKRNVSVGKRPPDDWVSEAVAEPALVAMELYLMSRPAERTLHRLLHQKRNPPRPPTAWGPKCPRSTRNPPQSREEEEHRCPSYPPTPSDSSERRISPTSPLSVAIVPSRKPKVIFRRSVVERPSSEAKVAAPARRKRKMTVLELRECETSLLLERANLHKEVEQQKLMLEQLMQKNVELERMLEMKLVPAEDARNVLPFDLNECAAEDYED